MQPETLNFAKHVFITFTSRILIVLFGFLSTIIIARYFGPSGQGVVSLLIIITTIAVSLGHLGLPAANTYFINKKKEWLPQIITNSFWFSLIGGIAISVIVFVLAKYFKEAILGQINPIYLYIILFALPFNLGAVLFSQIVLGQKRYLTFNLITVVSGLLFLLATIIVFLLKLNLEKLIIGITLANIFAGLIFFAYYLHQYRIKSFFNFQIFQPMIGYGIKSYLATFLGYLVIRSDMFFVNYFLGTSSAGIYSIDVKFADLLLLLPTTVGTILFPEVSAKLNDKGSLTQQTFRSMLYFLILICLLTGLIFQPLILFLYGKEFLGAIIPFFWLIPGIIALGVGTILMQDLAGRGLPSIVFIAPFIALIVNVILNLILIPKLQINGAAISSSISYILMMGLTLQYFLSATKIHLLDLIMLRRDDINILKKYLLSKK